MRSDRLGMSGGGFAHSGHTAVEGRKVQFPSGDAWVQARGEDPRFCLDKVGKSR